MALNFNGNIPSSVYYNGWEVSKIIFNGHVIFEKEGVAQYKFSINYPPEESKLATLDEVIMGYGGEYRFALCALDRNDSGIYAISRDGYSEGPFYDYNNVLINADGSEWDYTYDICFWYPCNGNPEVSTNFGPVMFAIQLTDGDDDNSIFHDFLVDWAWVVMHEYSGFDNNGEETKFDVLLIVNPESPDQLLCFDGSSVYWGSYDDQYLVCFATQYLGEGDYLLAMFGVNEKIREEGALELSQGGAD